MNTTFLLRIASAIVCGTVLLLPACKKTEYVQEKRPYKNIETFTVKSYTGDSVNAAVSNGNIIVYWAAETQAPATISPSISVSEGAVISPASGTEVPFTEATVYTVTAEDGTTQTYRLKPVINHPIPRISSISPVSMAWITDTMVTVSGEYFLSADPSQIQVYAQRMSDGFEFDLNIVPSKLTATSISAYLPRYSDLQDTGMHKIWVKVGDRVSDMKELNIRIPSLYGSREILHLRFEEAGQEVHPGDSITLKFWDDYNGDVTKWYRKRFTRLAIESFVVEADQMVQTDSTIKFKLPPQPLIFPVYFLALYFIDGFNNPYYISRPIPESDRPKFVE